MVPLILLVTLLPLSGLFWLFVLAVYGLSERILKRISEVDGELVDVGVSSALQVPSFS